MRLRFLRATGLGDLAAEPGQILEVEAVRAREFLSSGRAVPASGEAAPPVPAVITADTIAPPEQPKHPRRNQK